MGGNFRALPVLMVVCTFVSAHACTVCNSQGGEQVRSGIFDGSFVLTLMAILAPVPVLLLSIVGLTHLLGKNQE